MDLRDRENLDLLAARLVPKYADFFANVFSALKTRDEELTAQVYASNLVEEGYSIRTWETVPLRVHVFVNESNLLRIEGRIDGGFFSDFVSKIDFQDNTQWVRSNTNPVDGVTCATTGACTLHVAYPNMLLPVPPELGDNYKYMDFMNLFKLICKYIQVHQLSSNDDPSYFTPDEVLHKILYPNHPVNHPVSFASLIDVVRTQIKPPGPFVINHPGDKKEQVFEIMVQKHSTSRMIEHAAIQKYNQALAEIDQEIAKCVANIQDENDEAMFLDKLAANPIGFMQEIINNPTGKPVKITGDNIDYTEMITSHEFYKQPWAIAAAAHVVNEQKKSAEKNSI